MPPNVDEHSIMIYFWDIWLDDRYGDRAPDYARL